MAPHKALFLTQLSIRVFLSSQKLMLWVLIRTEWGIHMTKWLGTWSLLLFLAPHKVGFFRISLLIPNGICSNEAQSTRKIKLFLVAQSMRKIKLFLALSGGVSAILQSGLILKKSYSVIWSDSQEHSKNVFAVNLGYGDNIHEFWWETFSECSRESDQIAE